VIFTITKEQFDEVTGRIAKYNSGYLQHGLLTLKMTPPLSKKRMDAAVKGEYKTASFCAFVVILFAGFLAVCCHYLFVPVPTRTNIQICSTVLICYLLDETAGELKRSACQGQERARLCRSVWCP
jgi:hypothetical protein